MERKFTEPSTDGGFGELFGEGGRERISRKLLERVIDERLSEKQAAYLRAYYFSGKNVYQVAEDYGVSASTVSRTIKRAEARIRETLKYFVR